MTSSRPSGPALPIRSPAGAETDAGRRETWPDVAKGLCIVLVVLWHVVVKQYQQVEWHTALPVSAARGLLNEQLLPFRMPLFFTISGMFAVRAVGRPWRDLLRSRIARFAALYALWVLVHTAVLSLTPAFDTAHAHDPLQLLAQLTISPTNLWYLAALALYSAIAKLTRRIPAPWLLGVAFLLSAAAAAQLIPNENNRWQLLQDLVFFLAGLRLRPLVESFAGTTTVRRLLLVAAGYGGALAAMAALHAQTRFGVWPLVCVPGALLGVALAVVVSQRLVRTTRLLAALGRRTLPVSVLHLPVVAALDALLRRPLSASQPASSSTALAVAAPLAATAAVVAACLLVHRLLLAARLGRLFDPLRPHRAGRTSVSVLALGALGAPGALGGDRDGDRTRRVLRVRA